MIASQYLQTPKLEVKLPSKAQAKKVATEQQILNHQIIVHISREIADTLAILSENGLISKSNIGYFTKLTDNDNDILCEMYKKNNASEYIFEDFQRVQAFFATLAVKSLSVFQISSDEKLIEILKVIYGMKFIINNAQFPITVTLTKNRLNSLF